MNWKKLNNIELENNFNPRIAEPDFQNYLNISLSKADEAKKILTGKFDVKYGTSNLQTLDIYTSDNSELSPIHMFIHGGYWRALDKSYHSHMAIPYVENNITFINLNYDLCPTVKLSDICNEIRDAIIWIYKNSRNFGGDPNNIVISGHSAGAHLASLMLNIDWSKHGLKKKVIKAAALISGIYEPEIVLKLEINNEIRLNKKDAYDNNAIVKPPLYKLPILLAVGELEPLGWINQSKKYAKTLIKNNLTAKYSVIKNNNHFSLIDTLADRSQPLDKAMIKLSKNN